MWIMAKEGFYSIAEKKPGEFHIRARERGDLETLVAVDGPFPGETIHVGDGDYTYRLVVNGREPVARFLYWLGLGIDYPNFKNEVAKTPGQGKKLSPYHRIWQIMVSALGGFGWKPGEPWPEEEEEEEEWEPPADDSWAQVSMLLDDEWFDNES